MIADETISEDDQDLRSVLDQLSEEAEKLRKLRELHALKAANRCQRKELEQIKARVEQTQTELLRLMLEVENVSGQIVSYYHKTNSLL